MDITYPSIQSASRYQGTDAITILDSAPGPVTDSGETFSICLYTNCQPNLQMTPCDYEIVSMASGSLIGTILGIDIDDLNTAPVPPAEENPAVPDEPADTESPEPPAILPDSANTERAEELAKKAEEFYGSLAESYDIESEKALDAEFSDMYAESAARSKDFTEAERLSMQLEEYLEKSEAKAADIDKSGGIRISVGAGGMTEVMNSILKAASEGISLEEALSAFVSGNAEENPYVKEKSGSANADVFLINPLSGEVTAAVNKGRIALDNDLEDLYSDDEAVLKLSDDLAAFIKYAMFNNSGDKDEKRVKAFLDHLIRKQVYADYDRYIQDLDSNVDVEAVIGVILERLRAAFDSVDNENDSSEEILPIPDPADELAEIKEGLQGYENENRGAPEEEIAGGEI